MCDLKFQVTHERSNFRGQEYYQENLLGFATAHLAGLIAILSVPDILEVIASLLIIVSRKFSQKNSTQCLCIILCN